MSDEKKWTSNLRKLEPCVHALWERFSAEICKLDFEKWHWISRFCDNFKIYLGKIAHTKVSQYVVAGDVVLNLAKYYQSTKIIKLLQIAFYRHFISFDLLEDGFFYMLAQYTSPEWKTVTSKLKKNWKRR